MDFVSDVVLATLRVAPSRVVSRAELMLLADCSSRRLRESVSELRRAGFLIVSYESGYRFARNVEEVNHVVANLERQERSLHEVIEVMRESAAVQFGQPK